MRNRTILAVLLFFLCGAAVFAQGILVEAESFREKGGWAVDQQFMDKMGSPYLIAHGLGVPVADAVTSVSIPSKGTWHVYVRTYNWTSPWTSQEGPGRFAVKIGGMELENELGGTGDGWMWQYAGKARLPEGEAVLSLCDLTGFDGRCDALFITRDRHAELPDGGDALRSF